MKGQTVGLVQGRQVGLQRVQAAVPVAIRKHQHAPGAGVLALVGHEQITVWRKGHQARLAEVLGVQVRLKAGRKSQSGVGPAGVGPLNHRAGAEGKQAAEKDHADWF
ncbi:hypothetical protein ACFP9V_24585 [Deinococcus radiopugnans]|uniref:hypothetical protein n=1 Tax=Deinococcus radiopugnans TaxID=57497 RepID=UPI00361B98A0